MIPFFSCGELCTCVHLNPLLCRQQKKRQTEDRESETMRWKSSSRRSFYVRHYLPVLLHWTPSLKSIEFTPAQRLNLRQSLVENDSAAPALQISESYTLVLQMYFGWNQNDFHILHHIYKLKSWIQSVLAT